MEDFWSRQANAQKYVFEFTPLGSLVTITANRPEPLEAAVRLSAGRFSEAGRPEEQSIRLQLVVDNRTTDPLPNDLPDRLHYQGVGEWISLSAEAWGHGFANLAMGEAVIFLSPALAAVPRLVSRYFIDHYLLNFFLTRWAMLHASCVLDPARERLIVMIAPHNTGKSTTALHLLRAGYHFLADGMALLRQAGAAFVVGGYPIGEVKLRDDVLARFPEYSGLPVQVREDRKTVIGLRTVHPERIVETTVSPPIIQLCFVERGESSQTEVRPLSTDEVWPRIMANTVYWDKAARLALHTATLQALLQVASVYRLKIGSDTADIIATIEGLR
jgi:hypothetical protein